MIVTMTVTTMVWAKLYQQLKFTNMTIQLLISVSACLSVRLSTFLSVCPQQSVTLTWLGSLSTSVTLELVKQSDLYWPGSRVQARLREVHAA